MPNNGNLLRSTIMRHITIPNSLTSSLFVNLLMTKMEFTIFFNSFSIFFFCAKFLNCSYYDIRLFKKKFRAFVNNVNEVKFDCFDNCRSFHASNLFARAHTLPFAFTTKEKVVYGRFFVYIFFLMKMDLFKTHCSITILMSKEHCESCLIIIFLIVARTKLIRRVEKHILINRFPCIPFQWLCDRSFENRHQKFVRF